MCGCNCVSVCACATHSSHCIEFSEKSYVLTIVALPTRSNQQEHTGVHKLKQDSNHQDGAIVALDEKKETVQEASN